MNKSRTKEARTDYNKKYYKENLEYERNRQLVRRFGITLREYEGLLQSQNGLCAICFKKSARNMHVDHCHISGNIRGLLCTKCNLALGLFKDSEENLVNAITYLKGNQLP